LKVFHIVSRKKIRKKIFLVWEPLIHNQVQKLLFNKLIVVGSRYENLLKFIHCLTSLANSFLS